MNRGSTVYSHAWLGVVGAASVAIGALVVALDRKDPPVDSKAAPIVHLPDPLALGERAEEARTEPGDALPDHHLQAALAGTYAVDLSAYYGVAPSEPLIVSAMLDFALSDDSFDDGWLIGRVRDLEVAGPAPLVAAFRGATPARSDGRPLAFAMRIDPAGDVVAQRFDPAMPPAVRSSLSTIAAGLTVARAAHDDPEQWQRVEVTATEATVQASYLVTADNVLVKRWERGTLAHAPDGARGHGTSILTYDDDGLAQAKYEYTLRVDTNLDPRGPAQIQQVASRIGVTRKHLGDGTWANDTALDALRSDAQLTLPGPGYPRSPRKPSDPDAAGEPAALPGLEELLANAGAAHLARDWQARRESVRDVAALVKRDEAALADLLERLAAPGLDGDPLRNLVEGLVSAESPAARAAWASAMGDGRLPEVARHSLVSALTFIAEPGEAVLAAAWTILDDRQSALRLPAVLALSAQAHLQEEQHPELAKALKERILARARPVLAPETGAAPDVDAPDMWLMAVGNLGGPECWALAAPYLRDLRDNVRRYAVEALRFVTLPAARIALAEAMLLDPDARNRRRAAEIALYHPQQAMQAPVLRALRDDPEPIVRIGAAHTIATWGVTSPALDAAVAAAAERETNREVKDILAGLAPEDASAEGANP